MSKEYLVDVVLPIQYCHDAAFPSTTTSCYPLVSSMYHMQYAIVPSHANNRPNSYVHGLPRSSSSLGKIQIVRAVMTSPSRSASRAEYHLGAVTQGTFH